MTVKTYSFELKMQLAFVRDELHGITRACEFVLVGPFRPLCPNHHNKSFECHQLSVQCQPGPTAVGCW